MLQRNYAALDAPLLSRLDALVGLHLQTTKPEVVFSAKCCNGYQGKYERVIEPEKNVVTPRQDRRRRARGRNAVSKAMRIDAGLASAVLDDVCRRAHASGGGLVVPTAAGNALPLRLQAQLVVDNNRSAALFQRFRLLLGPHSQLASPLALREDLRKASAEERNQTTSNRHGAYLVSPRTAPEALIRDLKSQRQWHERAMRGADGRLSEASPNPDG